MINAPSSASTSLPGTPSTQGFIPGAATPLFVSPPTTPGSGPIDASPMQVGSAAAAGVGALGAVLPIAPGSLPSYATLTASPSSTQLPLPAAPRPAAGAPAPQASAAGARSAAPPTRMTSIAPGGNSSDADLVETTLATLRSSPSGAQVVDRLLAIGAKVNVISDGEFAALGHQDAHAFFDPASDTIYLRRSELQGRDQRFSAVALAHEGTHLLDDAAGVANPFVARKAQLIAAAGGVATPAGAEAQKQALFELTMIKEARAFTFAGQVAKDLSVAVPANDPTSVSAAGRNDAATYARVWSTLLGSAYNPDKRSAPVTNF